MALDFFAGSVGGICGVFVGHPFDTVKFLGLYKGLLPPLAGFAAVNAVVFGVQGMTYRRLQPGRKNLFLSSVIAGLTQSFIISPMELVKTQMQLQGQGTTYKPGVLRTGKELQTFSGPLDCFQKLYKSGGIKACFRGLIPTFAREGPAIGLYITLFHELCDLFVAPDGNIHQLGIMHLLLAGGLAGSASWMVTYPVDVIKSRYQADIKGRYNGILDCIKTTYTSEGSVVFFRGLSTAIIRGFPVNAATLATVTLILRYGRSTHRDLYVVER